VRAFLNGANIHYAETGVPTGVPVLFLHGFPFSHEMWKAQLDLAGTAGFRAIAHDIRGHGQSDVGDGQYTIEGHVDDLIALLNHLRIPRAILVGLSMGGYIALRTLQRNPDRVLGAALCDTRSGADSDEGRIKRAVTAAQVKASGSAAFADGFVKAVFAEETFTTNPAAIAFIRNIIAHTPPLSIAGTLLALAGRTDTTSALPGITAPTLILVGEKDVTTPVADSRQMQEKIRGSEMHVVPRAAHMSNLENPEFFNTKLAGFLTRAGR
jgi:pimeloyl-ACP methyl ester carboxylesterase